MTRLDLASQVLKEVITTVSMKVKRRTNYSMQKRLKELTSSTHLNTMNFKEVSLLLL